MVLKLIGGILIIAASSFIGFIYSRDLSRRPHDLRMLQSMLQMLENEIVYLSDVLPDAFERISRINNAEVAVFFEKAAQNLRKEKCIDAASAWGNAVKENIYKTALNEEDEKILLLFGKLLGSTDIDGQIKNIRLTVQQLGQQEQKAEEFKKKNETLYRNLGILGGIAIILILI